MQWTERHIVLLRDKQIFEVPPHRTGNIGPVRGATTFFRHRARIELVLVFSGFKGSLENFWHSAFKSARDVNSYSYFRQARDFLVLKFDPNSTKFFAAGVPKGVTATTNDAKEIVTKRRPSMEPSKNISSIAPETSDPSLDRLLFPARHFNHPDEVVGDRTLDIQEKRAILASWASDACAVESMPALRKPPGAARPVTFDAVMDALRRLDNSRGEVGCERRAQGRPQRLDA